MVGSAGQPLVDSLTWAHASTVSASIWAFARPSSAPLAGRCSTDAGAINGLLERIRLHSCLHSWGLHHLEEFNRGARNIEVRVPVKDLLCGVERLSLHNGVSTDPTLAG